jgi:hypothetical protein
MDLTQLANLGFIGGVTVRRSRSVVAPLWSRHALGLPLRVHTEHE